MDCEGDSPLHPKVSELRLRHNVKMQTEPLSSGNIDIPVVSQETSTVESGNKRTSKSINKPSGSKKSVDMLIIEPVIVNSNSYYSVTSNSSFPPTSSGSSDYDTKSVYINSLNNHSAYTDATLHANISKNQTSSRTFISGDLPEDSRMLGITLPDDNPITH